MRTYHRGARGAEDPYFYFGYDTLVSLFVVRALTDFSKTATRTTNDDPLMNRLTSDPQFIHRGKAWPD
jgi:hypothetical protein